MGLLPSGAAANVRSPQKVIALLLATAALLCGPAGPDRAVAGEADVASVTPTTLRLATGSAGGTFLPVGEDLAAWCASAIPGLTVVVDTTAGTVDNLKRLVAGEADLAIVGASPLRKILDERGRLSRGLEEICIVGTLYEDAEQYVVRTSLIRAQSMLDLNGLLMYPGPYQSGGEIDTRTILETLRVEPRFVYPLDRDKGYLEAADALARGEFDACTFSGGVPIEAVTELFRNHPDEFSIVPFSRHQLSKIRHARLDFDPVVIPAGTYPGQGRDIMSVGGPNVLVASPFLGDEIIAVLDKAICAGLEHPEHGLRSPSSHPVLQSLTVGQWRRSPLEEGRCRSILSASSEQTP